MAIRGGDGSIILTTQIDQSGLNKGMASLKGAITKLGAAIGVAFGVHALVQFGKQAVQLASDLQEVQNVVDVAFGDMAYRMEQFADTAIETFGISKLTAKQTGSSYMAMAKGMQIADDAAADMALTLTGLSADMSSFYNIRQEEARMALSAVFTGETETLKRYGILITEVNLQEYARQQGITKSINAMTQQEKVMLRYQYILQATQLAQGDFVRTQDSWANQTRILSERWKEMQTAFGEAFMTIGVLVLPVINSIISGLTRIAQIAQIVAQWIYKIFTGKELKASTSTTNAQAQALSGVGSSANEAANGMDKLGKSTNKAGKEAKKSLAAFDDLSIVSENSSAGGGGGGGTGGGGGVAGDFGDVSFEDSQLFETEQYDELLEKLQGALVLVGLIGTSLLAWKISDLLLTDSAKFLGQLQIISGWIMIVAGAILLLQGYSDAWANGIDWGNLATTIGGLALLISGIAIAISPMAAAFVAVGSGIALVVLGIKDIVENGPSVQNILTIISGILISTFGVLAAMGKISVFGSLLPVLATLAGAFITLYGVTDAWMNGLDWTNFTAILGGLAIAITAIALSSDAMYAGIALVAGGIIALVVGMNDFIQNGASMQNTILIIGGAIAIAVGLATAGLSVLVSAIIGAVTAIGAFVAAIILEEPAIMSVTEAQENYTQAKENAVKAENNYISAVDGAEASMKKLEDAEKKTGISGEELFKQVQSGSLDYANLTDAQKEVYKAYLDNEQKQKELKASAEALTEAKKAETIASFENDLALAKESGSYDEYKTSVIEAFKEGTLSAEEARELIGKSMSEMSTDAQQTFMEDIPNDIKDGLDPNQYETTRKKIGDFFVDLWGDIKNVFAEVGTWFKTKFDEAWTNIKNVFASWGEFFGGLWDTVKTKFTQFGTKMGDAIGDAVKSGINGVLSLIERTINRAINLINGAIDLINLIPGVSVGKVGRITIPRLAQGAVIPPNREFLAVLGDQKQGTNIEAPLDTIVEAMNIALQNNGAGQTTKEEHYYLGETELMSIIYRLVKGGERLRGNSLITGGGY